MKRNRSTRNTYVLTGLIAGLLIAAIALGTSFLAGSSHDVHTSNAANDHWKVIYVNRPGNLASKIQEIPSSCRIEITPAGNNDYYIAYASPE